MTDDVSLFSAIKPVAEIVKTLAPIVREAKSKGLDPQYADELNDAIADMQTALFDARQDALDAQRIQFEQSARIGELEQTIAEFENWEAEKERYKLVNASTNEGIFVYLLRKETAEDEPLHYICPKCFASKIKSILNLIYHNGFGAKCPECKTPFKVDAGMVRSHGVIS